MRPAVTWTGLAAVGVAALAVVAWVLWPQGTGGQTRTHEAGGVTVTATLADGHPLVFEVVLDTHTVDLTGYDVVANTRLEAGGQTLAPRGESRTTDNTGHHAEATLTFEGTHEGRLVLVVRDLGGVPERRLEFQA